jgi:hypothetical protein
MSSSAGTSRSSAWLEPVTALETRATERSAAAEEADNPPNN